MANEEQVKILLEQGVEVWNKWRRKNRRIRPDLRGADLSGANLSRVNLNESDLSEANLSESDLNGAYLSEAYLSRADLREAGLNGAKLNGATLSHANLFSADLREAILSGAILNEAFLSKTKLNGAGLSEADLRWAKLREADLSEADLSGADLSGADLSRANLGWTHLYIANLSGAHLRRTDFWGANLSRADLDKAEVGSTNFGNLDLSRTKGLDTVIHEGPSTIGTDTLVRSRGQIPEVFLRGCGLSDWEIEAAKLYQSNLTSEAFIDITYKMRELLIDNPIQFYSCFISYSHADKQFARQLHDALQASGIRCWLDEHQMLPGDDIYEQVDRGIKLWDKTLLCCSKAALTSWWVDHEINKAFEKERQLMRERGQKVLALIPLDLDGFLFTGGWQNGKKGEVQSRLAADFRGWEKDRGKVKQNLKRVIRALRADEGGREPPPVARL